MNVKQFAPCINNTDYEASLITRKVYEGIPDEQAERDDLIRVIDESREDYLYHTSHFIFIHIPAEVEKNIGCGITGFGTTYITSGLYVRSLVL